MKTPIGTDKTPHFIIVEDKAIKCLVYGLISKINEKYRFKDEGQDQNDYVFDSETNNIICGIYTLKDGKKDFEGIPDVSGFENLESILLIADNDAEEEIKNFYLELNKKQKAFDIPTVKHILLPMRSEDGHEIEDYIYKYSENDKEKFKKIECFTTKYIQQFKLNYHYEHKIGKRVLSIFMYLENENLRNIDESKCNYIKDFARQISEKDEVFVDFKDFWEALSNFLQS